jgi:hypothetical protein
MIKWNCNLAFIKQYTVADGLPSNIVYGVLDDAQGRLWLSTDAVAKSYW